MVFWKKIAKICKIENLLQIISFFFFWSWKFAKFQQQKKKGKLFPMYNIGTNIIYLFQFTKPFALPFYLTFTHLYIHMINIKKMINWKPLPLTLKSFGYTLTVIDNFPLP
jgi:hypothetical protein